MIIKIMMMTGRQIIDVYDENDDYCDNDDDVVVDYDYDDDDDDDYNDDDYDDYLSGFRSWGL